MLDTLKQIFARPLQAQAARGRDEGQLSPVLAEVALMVEIISVDDGFRAQERKLLRRLLQQQFDLHGEELEALIEQAEAAHRESTDFHRFTSELNRNYDAAQKVALIENLWRLAWADEELQALEQHVIRRLAKLLHVSHKDFIATKLSVTGG